ncbi:hypothetical protein AAMO2058_001118900 [Amorphochlora amoebiformis]
MPGRRGSKKGIEEDNPSFQKEDEDSDFLAFNQDHEDDQLDIQEGSDDEGKPQDGEEDGKEEKGLSDKQKNELLAIGEEAAKRIERIKRKRLNNEMEGKEDKDDDQDHLKGTVLKEEEKEEQMKEKVALVERGVLYLGHIPHGFFEEEMRGFFSQFGTVTRLRLSRNPKTKKSRGYAFIEFAIPEVADIVSKAFNGYMMFGRTLVAKRIPPEKVHPRMFYGSNKSLKAILRVKNTREAEKRKYNQVRTKSQHAKRIKSLIQRERKERQKLKEAGIDYDFYGYEEQYKAQTATHILFDDDETS